MAQLDIHKLRLQLLIRNTFLLHSKELEKELTNINKKT